MSSQRRAVLIALWVVTLAVAFLVGTQFPLGPAAPPAPTATTPTPTDAPGASPEAAATPDARFEQFLLDLPRRRADDPLALGRLDARVVLTNWSDYRCPFCARWHQETLPGLQRYVDDGTLRIEFRDLVLFGEQSEDTAVAARAAGRQGRFWQFQEAVYAAAPASGHPAIDRQAILAFARQAGVPDLAGFEQALADEALRAAVQSDTREAQQLGISGTPFFVVGRQVVNGAQPVEAFRSIIEAEAAR